MNSFKFYKSDNIEFVLIKNRIISFGEHSHASVFSISIILEGSAIFKRPDNSIVTYKGDIYTVNPYVTHSVSSNVPLSMLTMCISKNAVYHYNCSEYRNLIRGSMFSFQQKADISVQIIELLVSAAYILYEKNHAIKENVADLYEKNRTIIENAPETSENLDELSSYVFISKYHYVRMFRKKAGLPPHRFQLQNRIRKAQKLLLEGYSIAETAVETGFYDQSHFNKFFKRIVGLSPSNYIKAVSNFLQD